VESSSTLATDGTLQPMAIGDLATTLKSLLNRRTEIYQRPSTKAR
jgi:hypothetical protein